MAVVCKINKKHIFSHFMKQQTLSSLVKAVANNVFKKSPEVRDSSQSISSDTLQGVSSE